MFGCMKSMFDRKPLTSTCELLLCESVYLFMYHQLCVTLVLDEATCKYFVIWYLPDLQRSECILFQISPDAISIPYLLSHLRSKFPSVGRL